MPISNVIAAVGAAFIVKQVAILVTTVSLHLALTHRALTHRALTVGLYERVAADAANTSKYARSR